MPLMNLYLETSTEAMQEIAKQIYKNLDKDYYLAGGTALALKIGHRKSIDLDYFIRKDIDTALLKGKLADIFSDVDVEVLFEEKNTLWTRINGVNVSFISRKDNLLEKVVEEDFFRLADLRDITVMKLSAILSREEYKDYFDMACLSKKTDAREWPSWWQEIYPKEDLTSWLVALSAIDMMTKIPLEIMDDYKEIDVSRTLKNIVQEITKFIEKTET